jgi:hypothetical protein
VILKLQALACAKCQCTATRTHCGFVELPDCLTPWMQRKSVKDTDVRSQTKRSLILKNVSCFGRFLPNAFQFQSTNYPGILRQSLRGKHSHNISLNDILYERCASHCSHSNGKVTAGHYTWQYRLTLIQLPISSLMDLSYDSCLRYTPASLTKHG